MYFNALSNATYPIQIHRAVPEKLRFEKKKKKNEKNFKNI